jgi:hypothetical protein
MAVWFFILTLLMIAIVVYILIVRKRNRSKDTNAGFVASEMPWLDELIDKLEK